jgi:hypothetical protein
VDVADADMFTKFQHVSGAVKVGSPRFAGAVGPEKFQDGGTVNDAAAVRSDPFLVACRQTEAGLTDIAIQHYGAWERPLVLLLPVLHDLFDSFAGGGAT